MLNHKGEVAECTGDNIFVIKDGFLRTPPISAGAATMLAAVEVRNWRRFMNASR